MMPVLKDLREEVRTVFKGKTLDALVPTLLFVLFNVWASLSVAAGVAIGSGVGLFVYRLIRKKTIWYALFGLLGVVLASGYALLAGQASDFFLPQLISGTATIFIVVLSLVIQKPIAVFLSHLTRGFPLDWYWRKDILPAYREVTLMWAVFLVARLLVLISLYTDGDIIALGWANVVLGFPMTLGVLVLSYLYGIWRLRTLKGPGVEEFTRGDAPPWKGQTKGF